MSEPRSQAAQRIIDALEEGRLDENEINRRLNAVIEAEYKKGKEADTELIKACENLLESLFTPERTPYADHSERFFSYLKKNTVVREKRRPFAGRKLIRAVALAAAILVFTVIGDGILQFHWFTASPTDDRQQYAIQGHEIDAALIRRCIAEHSQDSQDFVTENWQEAVDYLGFTPYNFSQEERISVEKIQVLTSPVAIRVSIWYSQEDNNRFLLDTMYYQSVENAYLSFEQNKTNGIMEIIGDNNVYITSNMNNTTYVWIKGSAVLSLLSKGPIESPNEIITKINGGIEDE